MLSKPGEDLYDWVKSRLTGAGAQATLQELVQQPESEARWKALQAQIEAALEENVQFRGELRDRLATAGITQEATVEGDGNKVVQNIGSGSTIIIH